MTYYAHIDTANNRYETVIEHGDNAGHLAKEFGKSIYVPYTAETIGKRHDLGKMTARFREILSRKMIKVDHACVGAAVMFRMCQMRGISEEASLIIYNLIRAHHNGLTDDCIFDPDLIEDVEDDVEDTLHNYGKIIKGKINALSSESELEYIWSQVKDDACEFEKELDFAIKDKTPVEKMLFIRLLFSCLVDADYTSTSQFYQDDYIAYSEGTRLNPEVLLQLLADYMSRLKENSANLPINALRSEVYADATACGRTCNSRFYTMTAPTGLGKTLAMAKFALEQAQRNNASRIFIVLPYLSITDQTVCILQDIFGKEAVLRDDSTTEHTEQTKTLAERWTSPIIVTTTVKFFETMFSNQPIVLRKLHRIAGAVLLFDEAQTLPSDLADITINSLQALTSYNSVILLSTATPPAFDMRKGITYKPHEIIHDVEGLYAKVAKIRTNSVVFSEKTWTTAALDAYFSTDSQVIYVFNTRKKAEAMYHLLLERYQEKSVFLISTSLCIADRMDRMSIIKQRLAEGLPCYIASTQCIEAGVDIDVPCGAREYAPLPSIVQAIGRINRNGKGNGKVLVFTFENEYGKEGGYPDQRYHLEANITKYLAERHQWALDVTDPKMIRQYYREIFKGDGIESHDIREITDAVEDMNFAEVAENYHIIKDNASVNIIVPYEGKSDVYEKIINEIIENGMCIKKIHMQTAHAEGVIVNMYVEGEYAKTVLQMCEQLSIRYHAFTEPTNWYILTDKNAYKTGAGIITSPSGGII